MVVRIFLVLLGMLVAATALAQDSRATEAS